jgi:hypothetical protein
MDLSFCLKGIFQEDKKPPSGGFFIIYMLKRLLIGDAYWHDS